MFGLCLDSTVEARKIRSVDQERPTACGGWLATRFGIPRMLAVGRGAVRSLARPRDTVNDMPAPNARQFNQKEANDSALGR